MIGLPGKNKNLFWFVAIPVWIVVSGYISYINPVIVTGDLHVYIDIAKNLSFYSAGSWAHGFYPFGYPLLLKLFTYITGDYLVSGRIISILFSAAGLYVLYRLTCNLFGGKIALVTLLFLVTNPVYIFVTSFTGSDMPAAVTLLFSLWFVTRYTAYGNNRELFIAGLLGGASYLFRYTGLILPAAVILWIFVSGISHNKKRGFKKHPAVIFAAGFLLVSLPQLVASLISQGNPFYNLQYKNIYFGMFGEMNWGINWRNTENAKSFLQVVTSYPVEFIRNWRNNMAEVFRLHLVQFPLMFVAFAGMLAAIKYRQKEKYHLLAVIYFAAYTAAVSMALVTPRLLLPATLILLPYSAYGIYKFLPGRLYIFSKFRFPLRITVIAAFVVFYFAVYNIPRLTKPMTNDFTPVKISRLLEERNIEDPKKVLVLFFSYDTRKPDKESFAIPWYDNGFEPYRSFEDIYNRMLAGGQEYLAFNDISVKMIPGFENFWPDQKEELKRYFEKVKEYEDGLKIYRIKPFAEK